MLRKLALSLAIAGALGTSNASALGLGEIRITSALNEPLKAEIQLLQMRSIDPQQVQPKMANVDDFALAGIEKLRFLSDVKFEVKPSASGQGTIILTSTTPVKEPFLNFLLEVNWPSGRLVREYTVLLDPPVYDPTPPPVTVQPARAAATVDASSAPVVTKPLVNQPSANNIRTRMDDGQVYVDIDDTLWEIAKRHKPSSAVTEAQMMLALQRKNPTAFRNNNVNQLKAGVVMDLPSESEVKGLSAPQADKEFWRQTQMWRQGVTTKAASVPVNTPKLENAHQQVSESGKKTEGTAAASDSDQGQLKIISSDRAAETSTVSDQAANADMSQAGSGLAEKNQQLETELAGSLESVDQVQRENEELSGRVDALAQQMESLQRLLELKDQQMAELQAELALAKGQPGDASAEPTTGAKKSLLEEFGLYIGALGGAIIAFLLALLFRRGKKEDEVAPVLPEPAVTAVAASKSDETEEKAENEIVEAKVEDEVVIASASKVEDLDDLDLDMEVEQVETAAIDSTVEDDFDLGFDDDFDPEVKANVEGVDDDALDSILGEDTEVFNFDDLDDPQVNGLGDVPMDLPEDEPEPEADSIDDLLASVREPEAGEGDTDLAFDLQPQADVIDEVEAIEDESLTDELDFNLDLDEPEVDTADSLGDHDLELDELSEASADALTLDDIEANADSELDQLLDSASEADEAKRDENDVVVLDEKEMQNTASNESPIGQDLDAELDSELEMLLSDAGSDELSLAMTDDADEGGLDNMSLLEDADEVETKLDLARAYLDMEDLEGAKDILGEIIKEGNDAQQSEAKELLGSIR